MPYTKSEIIKNWMDPDFKFFVNRMHPLANKKFLLEEDRMKGEYLGACLDYIRWGGTSTVMYEMSTHGMIRFIGDWIGLNQDELFWHENPLPKDFDLPRIDDESCSMHRSYEIVTDRGGRKRCGNVECYSILSDKGVILPLEEVLDRLNKGRKSLEYCGSPLEMDDDPCKRLGEVDKKSRKLYEENCWGHPMKETVHPFSGWTLAWYVQKWYEQIEEAPIFN